MHILLVEPAYYTRYPPLGLLKLASYHELRGDTVDLIRGCHTISHVPDKVYVTSLFTYAWGPVHEAISFYGDTYKKAEIVVGGIYASLCSKHIRQTFGDRVEIHEGLVPEAEELMPDYSLFPEWKASIIFASRGCTRKCRFCSVPVLEPGFEAEIDQESHVSWTHEGYSLGQQHSCLSSHWHDIFGELEESGIEVDFNQGLDARLITQDVAVRLSRLRVQMKRLAYDSKEVRAPLSRAIGLLRDLGVNGRRIAGVLSLQSP